jgi:hypothetical protein
LERPALSRVAQLRHTSPGRLQLLLGVLVVLGLLTGLAVGVTASSAAGGTGDLGDRAQPLLVEAETIYSALADADTTAAQAFLAGGLEPPELTRRYENDLTRASTALTSAARRTPADGPSARAINELSSGVARYAGLVASARANNRQGLPVGASYLSTASTLNRETLQPQAQALFRSARAEVDDGYSAARATVWGALLLLLAIGLFTALIYAQRHLSRTTRRTFNIPLIAATAVAALLVLGTASVLVVQRAHLRAAGSDGSTPVSLLAEARILALRERGDEALTLAARGGGSAYESDFATVSDRLSGPNGLLAAATRTVDGDARDAVRSATGNHAAYVEAHAEVRRLDDAGDYDRAVALAIGPQTSQTFEKLTGDIGRAIESSKAAFDREIGAAGRGLGLLTVLGPLLGLLIAGLAAMGIRARLEEYR